MKNERKDEKNKDANRDPITGAPGSHPIGTGAGAAAGGLAGAGAGAAIGAATGTATGGPIGAGVGIVAGAVVGAMGGKAAAEAVNPTEEDACWRDNHSRESYHKSDYTWDDYSGAYRTGYEGYGRLGRSHNRFEDAEQDLRKDYEARSGNSRLRWENARPAARAAWDRVQKRHSSQGRNLESLIGNDVYDVNDNKIGTLKCLWSNEEGDAEYVGVSTGWLFGKTHVVPAQSVQVGERSRRIRLPYTEEKIKDAPSYDADAELNDGTEQEVLRYYGIAGTQKGRMQGHQQPQQQSTERRAERRPQGEEAQVRLSEEKLKVGKRQVEAGGVRLRKVIRTEVVNQPVELQREEVIIERVPANEAAQGTGTSFQEEEVFIPLRREEAVVQKEERVREVVRARKQSQSDRQEVTEKVRKEDVEIESTGEAREATRGGDAARRGTPAEEMAERENIPRSRRNPK